MPVENPREFLTADQQALLADKLVICTLTGKTYADLKAEGLPFKIPADLEQELLQDRPKNRSHTNQVAFCYPGLFLPDSGNLPLAEQDHLVWEDALNLKGRLKLVAVAGGISRFTDYGEIILQYFKRGIRLLERGSYPYLCARTRTRVFPNMVGIQNYVVDIGPFDQDGLNVRIMGRDEEEPDVGAWPLFYPTDISVAPPGAARLLLPNGHRR